MRHKLKESGNLRLLVNCYYGHPGNKTSFCKYSQTGEVHTMLLNAYPIAGMQAQVERGVWAAPPLQLDIVMKSLF